MGHPSYQHRAAPRLTHQLEFRLRTAPVLRPLDKLPRETFSRRSSEPAGGGALGTRLYVAIDDMIDHAEWAPERPAVRIASRLSATESQVLAVTEYCSGSRPRSDSSAQTAAGRRPGTDP